MSTIFTKIIEREIPGQFIYEDDLCVALMDKFPSVEGQSLIILKREVSYVFDMTDEEYNHLFAVAKKVAQATDKVLDPERTCLIVEGFEVPHVHIKLFPVQNIGEAASLHSVIGERKEESDDTLEAMAQKIKAAL